MLIGKKPRRHDRVILELASLAPCLNLVVVVGHGDGIRKPSSEMCGDLCRISLGGVARTLGDLELPLYKLSEMLFAVFAIIGYPGNPMGASSRRD